MFVTVEEFFTLMANSNLDDSTLILVYEMGDDAVIEFDGQYYQLGKMSPLYNLLLNAVRSSPVDE